MSRQDADINTRSRPRANTTFASSFAWRRQKPEHPLSPQLTPSSHVLSVDDLIEALTPPAVPSLAHARALASELSTCSPIPRQVLLIPVLASLCAAESPISFQAAGFDILSAYWENNEAPALGTADRLTYFSFFLGPGTRWGTELWEPRFKALRSLTRWGVQILGLETQFINLFKSWILGAFEGLLCPEPIDRAEKAERERSIAILSEFLNMVAEKPEVIARIPEEELAGVLQFYADLVDRSINFTVDPLNRPSLFHHTGSESTSSTPARTSYQTHRRHPSSVSLSSLPSPTTTPSAFISPAIPPMKQPFDIAINLYLNHLTAQLKSLSRTHLDMIVPLLFRALSSCASPLPRLTLSPQMSKKASSEERIAEALSSLFSGPYSSTCMIILKQHSYPPSLSGDGTLSPSDRDVFTTGNDVDTTQKTVKAALQTSLGAQRTLRNYIRRALYTRLARAYISQEASTNYSHSGAFGPMDVGKDLMERAWPKDDMGTSGWEAGRLGKFMAGSIEAWVDFGYGDLGEEWAWVGEGKERILEEAAGTLRDILHELDSRDDEIVSLEDDEAIAVGESLYNLAGCVFPLKNLDNTPYFVPLSQPSAAPTPFLRALCSLLARDHSTNLTPMLSKILLHISEHLTDSDTAKLPLIMTEQHDLSPTSPDWLDNWRSFLDRDSTLVSSRRPLTKKAIMESLEGVYDSVRDMMAYRRPLADMVFDLCGRISEGEGQDDELDDCDALWRILGDEVVLRTVEREAEEEDDESVPRFIDLLVTVASDAGGEEEDVPDTASVMTVDTHSPSPHVPYSIPSTIVSPILSRINSDYHSREKDKDKEPGIMSLLSSLATGASSRSQSIQPRGMEELPDDSTSPPALDCRPSLCTVGAASALISIFSQLSFTPFVLEERSLTLALHVYEILTDLLANVKSARVRLTILQFLMRLRADRDHRVYFAQAGFDADGQVAALGSLINRDAQKDESGSGEYFNADVVSELRKPRPRLPQERDGRRPSRGRGAGERSKANSSRSRSRAPYGIPTTPQLRPRDPIWQMPERLPFAIADVDTPSEALITYDPIGPNHAPVLSISRYLSVVVNIIEQERNWEILSYVLCHLPTQLANKHLFCGPKSRDVISRLLTSLCTTIISGDFAGNVDRWPTGLKQRDGHGLAFHILSVLVSYRRCFDLKQRHLLVEVFQSGLDGQPATIKCCLHALSLAAFELQSSTTKCLSRILEKLSQIMSNPDMAVHILGFLSIIGSQSTLYANFTEGDFKMVFGVALQYLQHHNRIGKSPTLSWALSQHVRILSYFLVYVWFLAVKLPDRPRHVRFIARQLLLANEGKDAVDDLTEVCFDWLARYTYASADPRPANSLFNDIVMNPTTPRPPSEAVTNEKTWVLGTSVVTIRTLARLGWIEVLSRRPSGYTKFLCRVENAPMVGPGDVDPDIFSVPASLLMERDLPRAQRPDPENVPIDSEEATQNPIREDLISAPSDDSLADAESTSTPRPDPITGYVWSGSAPSQRRKDVSIDPAFLALQLSAYPERMGPSHVRMIVDPALLPKFISSLDRIPVIDTHKVGIMYVAPGQTSETDILRNTHGSPAYTRFLEGIGRLINLRGQYDVYAGGLDPDEDGEYAYAWWDDIGQILYHTATMMPSPDPPESDPQCTNKKRHIGNDYVRIVWNDSGLPYAFETLSTQFQFVNIVIEPHSLGAIAAFSNSLHENEYFKVTVQRAAGMPEFAPVGEYKLISAENLPMLVRQLSLLADWFASVFARTERDTQRVEMKTNWQGRLEAIRRFKAVVVGARDKKSESEGAGGGAGAGGGEGGENGGEREREGVGGTGVMAQETYRDFTILF